MSLFNKPTWAKTQTAAPDADETPNNIFSHSNRSYREIVAEQERKKLARTEKEKRKLKVKEERKNTAKRDIHHNVATGSSPKRRRVSLPEENEKNFAQQSSPRESGLEESVVYSEHEEPDEDYKTRIRGPRIRQWPRKNDYGILDSEPAWQQNFATELVELGDSDSSDDIVGVEAAPLAPSKPTEVVEDESDDEFAELARRARQQRQHQSLSKKLSQTPEGAAYSPSLSRGGLHTGHDRLATSPPDPTIELFISSRLEDTNPMIVYRKLSQNLADVRRVWCERQRFSERKAEEIYFVHRMRRVYDVTTCRSLGIEIDSLGNLMLKGGGVQENVDKVHLEAVTDEIFRQMKAERVQGVQEGNGELESRASAEDDRPPRSKHQQSEPLIRLVLKAKGREDFKLKVKPTTAFSRIIAAYAKTQQLGENISVRLEFDGDRLDPDNEVQSTEVSDLDCIDVHLTAAS